MVRAISPRRASDVSYDLPTTDQLHQPKIADAFMTKMIAQDENIEKFHRTMARHGIATRFAYALILRSDPKAFEAWSRSPRVLGISKPVKGANDCAARAHVCNNSRSEEG